MSRSLLATTAFLAILVGSCSTAGESATTTEPAPLVTVALDAEGLGDVLFGLDPDTVAADLTARFGAPDLDSGWIPSEPNIYGTCPGDTMRAIGWGSLVTIFLNDSESDLGGWFYTYTYGYDYSENVGGVDPRGLNLLVEDRVGLGTTLAELIEAWGQDVMVAGDADLDVWAFTAPGTGFKGLLSGPNDSDVVTLIEPTESCAQR